MIILPSTSCWSRHFTFSSESNTLKLNPRTDMRSAPTYLRTVHVRSLSILINPSDQSFMPFWAFQTRKKVGCSQFPCRARGVPSLPPQLSSSGPDEAHVKEHIQHVSTTVASTHGLNLNNETGWKVDVLQQKVWHVERPYCNVWQMRLNHLSPD